MPPRRLLFPALLACLLVPAALPARAETAGRGTAGPEAGMNWLDRSADAASRAGEQLREQAERAVILGGVLLYRHRHTISGTMLGCAAGAAAGGAAAVTAGTVTGGAALLGTGEAMALGCGLGSAAGASVGYPLDHIFDAP
jgi:hypothetical protein